MKTAPVFPSQDSEVVAPAGAALSQKLSKFVFGGPLGEGVLTASAQPTPMRASLTAWRDAETERAA